MTSSGWMLTEWIGLNSIVCTCIASICSEYFYTYTIHTLECIYLFCILIYFKYTVHLCTCMHLFVQASAIPCTRCSYMRQAGSSSYHRFTLMGELWGIIYTYTLMGNHIQLCTYTLIHLYTYTLMQHHIQCNKLKPQHSLVQCTLCMWYMHVPPPDTTDSHLWSYCVCVEVSILGPI